MIKFERLTADNNKNGSNIHSIPFIVEAEGHANVSKYFECKIQKDDTPDVENVLKNSLYGRALKGQEIKVPENYIGNCVY